MSAVLIDANLLVLLIVGAVSRQLIGRHRRLREYSEEDFDLLCRLISGYSRILVTPNTLTEASNLCRQFSGREAVRIGQVFRAFVNDDAEEQYIESKIAVRDEQFISWGLADSATLALMTSNPVLITTDPDLFVAAKRRGYTAINFNHARPEW